MKVKLTLTAVWEIEINPENYPEEVRDDPEKMAQIDAQNYRDDPYMLLDAAAEYGSVDVKAEVKD